MSSYLDQAFETLKDKLNEQRLEYLRAIEMSKTNECTEPRIRYEMGVYDGLEKAWRVVVQLRSEESEGK